jgi:uncharacterized protein (DUF488 family)
MAQIFTIGHSTHPLDRFLALLARHQIELLADIRRFPGSRKYPHFNRDSLTVSLPESGVRYLWIESLGGRRQIKSRVPSRNSGLRNESFRNYADYMATAEFQQGARQLLEAAGQKRTAYMCSEGLFWRCHRRLVSDFLLASGFKVEHIMPSGELRPHTLTGGAQVQGRDVTYPSAEARPGGLLFE